MGYFQRKDLEKIKYHKMFLDVIKKQKPIQTKYGTGTLQISKNYTDYLDLVKKGDTKSIVQYLNPSRGKYIPIFTQNKKDITFIDIEKTQFSGIQRVSGTSIAEFSENAVAIGTAIIVYKKKFIFDKKVFLEMNKYLDLGKGKSKEDIEKTFEFLLQNPDWLKSIEKTSYEIYKTHKLKPGCTFHRNSVFMNSIYSEFQKLFKKEKNIYGFTFKNDKWNPSDIWIRCNNTKIPIENDLPHYNEKLLQDFLKNKIIGISLKKVGQNIHIKAYNVQKNDNIVIDFKEIKYPQTVFKTKDVYIVGIVNGKELRLQIRNFESGQNIQGEIQIKGTQARHGKIGFGNILAFLRKVLAANTFNIKNARELKKLDEEQILKLIQKELNSINQNYTLDVLEQELKKRNFSSSEKETFLISKYQALAIASVIEKMKPEQRTQFITLIFKYAMSMKFDERIASSAFLKVY